jgi:DNA-binding transcriptional LysR family regulator
MRYELTDLRLFLAIAEAHNLSAGASSVHITASSASYRLKNLEHALGTPLFLRNARGMELTPAGMVLLAHVRELLAGVQLMHSELGRFSAGLKGHVRLIANSSALNGFIIPSLGRFLVLNPDVNVDLEERQSEAIHAAVMAREADIGILAGDADLPGFRTLRYATDRLMVVTPLQHPLASEAELRMGAALDFDFVCMNRASSNYLFLHELAQRTGKTLRARLHAHSFEAVLSLVEAGVGIALVPSSIIGTAVQDGRLAAIELQEPWALRKLSLVMRAEGKLPAFTEEFVSFLLSDPRVSATREPA